MQPTKAGGKQKLLPHHPMLVEGKTYLVTQNQERSLSQILHSQQSIKLNLALGEALGILSIDEEDDAADLGEVVLPQAARLLMPAKIEGGEADRADGQLLASRVQRRLQDRDSVVLQHVQQCCLACVIQAEEEEFLFMGFMSAFYVPASGMV